MTQKAKLPIEGPIKITIEGPQGSGKTRISQALRDILEADNVLDRVTITERQNDPTQELLEALKPFAKAHATWSGGNTAHHFANAVFPADFLRASQALAKAGVKP